MQQVHGWTECRSSFKPRVESSVVEWDGQPGCEVRRALPISHCQRASKSKSRIARVMLNYAEGAGGIGPCVVVGLPGRGGRRAHGRGVVQAAAGYRREKIGHATADIGAAGDSSFETHKLLSADGLVVFECAMAHALAVA